MSRVAVPVLAAGAAAAVFGPGLGTLPLWRDEVASVDVAARPVAAILAAAGRIDVVHTAYYLLLHGVLVFGDSEAWVRLPSLLAAVAAVVAVVELARRGLGTGPAVVTGALLVGNPWFAFYAREARPYALGAALVAGAALALLGGPPARRRWVAFTALGVAATWIHLFDLLPVAALATTHALLSPRRSRGRCGVTAGAAQWLGLGALAVVPLVMVAAAQAGQVSWVAAPAGDDLARLLTDLAGSTAAEVAVAALLLAAALAAVVRPGRLFRKATFMSPEGVKVAFLNFRDGPAALFGAAFAAALAGPVVLFAVSWLGHPLYVERYVLASAPLVALAAGAAVRLLVGPRTPPGPGPHRRRWVGEGVVIAAVAAVALSGVPAAAAGPADKTEDLRAGAAALAAGYRPGDCVAYDPGWARVGFTHYLRRTGAAPFDVALDPARPVVALFPDELPAQEVAAHLRACSRVWVVGYPGPVGAWRPVPEVTGAALAAVAPGFTPAAPAAFGDLVVQLLRRR